MLWKVSGEGLTSNNDLGRLRNIGFSLRPAVANEQFSRLMTRLLVNLRVNQDTAGNVNGVCLAYQHSHMRDHSTRAYDGSGFRHHGSAIAIGADMGFWGWKPSAWWHCQRNTATNASHGLLTSTKNPADTPSKCAAFVAKFCPIFALA